MGSALQPSAGRCQGRAEAGIEQTSTAWTLVELLADYKEEHAVEAAVISITAPHYTDTTTTHYQPHTTVRLKNSVTIDPGDIPFPPDTPQESCGLIFSRQIQWLPQTRRTLGVDSELPRRRHIPVTMRI